MDTLMIVIAILLGDDGYITDAHAKAYTYESPAACQLVADKTNENASRIKGPLKSFAYCQTGV